MAPNSRFLTRRCAAVRNDCVVGFVGLGVGWCRYGVFHNRSDRDMSKTYCVYTLASGSRGLYTGVTGDLESPALQHRRGASNFSSRFRIFRLVHYEMFADVHAAMERETEIKVWRREKKARLIESKNPTWQDLSAQLPHVYKTKQTVK